METRTREILWGERSDQEQEQQLETSQDGLHLKSQARMPMPARLLSC